MSKVLRRIPVRQKLFYGGISIRSTLFLLFYYQFKDLFQSVISNRTLLFLSFPVPHLLSQLLFLSFPHLNSLRDPTTPPSSNSSEVLYLQIKWYSINGGTYIQIKNGIDNGVLIFTLVSIRLQYLPV